MTAGRQVRSRITAQAALRHDTIVRSDARHNPAMPPNAAPLIETHRDQIAQLCARARARRLDAFGSVVRADFSPERSDVDFLVEFDPLPPAELAEAWFMLKESLEALLGRPVNLLTERSLRNPWLRQRVESERINVYAS